MLKFCAICPHPPLIIPTIGGSEIEKVIDTVLAMKKLAVDLAEAKPETVIIISPHSPCSIKEMSVAGEDELTGHFGNFGDWKTELNFSLDQNLRDRILEVAESNNIPIRLAEFNPLDHGILVPLYYLTSQNSNFKIVPIAFSYLSPQDHVKFGQKINEIISSSSKNIALIASGDLSHALTADAPAGYSIMGKSFDQEVVKLIKKNKISDLINLKADLVESAAECGWRSFLILAGALQSYKHQAEVLSYEGPFGVGYLVAKFIIK